MGNEPELSKALLLQSAVHGAARHSICSAERSGLPASLTGLPRQERSAHGIANMLLRQTGQLGCLLTTCFCQALIF